jgi:hypothetical protein
VINSPTMNIPRERKAFTTDKRRKHHHWQAIVYYHDGETFARTYIDCQKATAFAKRQKKSPVVKRTRVAQVS